MSPHNAADNLADNIKALRESRGLSQQQIAKAAGIPRATWTHLESGGANPTLAVLMKVASALQIRLDELLAPPRQPARHLTAAELPTRSKGQVAIRKLLPEPNPDGGNVLYVRDEAFVAERVRTAAAVNVYGVAV